MVMESKVKKTKATKKVDSKSVASKKVKKTKPTFEQIKERAYQIYVESGYQGTDEENWLKAENELK